MTDMLPDEQELNKILDSADQRRGITSNHRYLSNENNIIVPQAESKKPGNYMQWSTTDNTSFYPASKTVDTLPPAYYEIRLCLNTHQKYFYRLEINTDDILRFPHASSDRVLEEIQSFWQMEKRYARNKIAYKRGIFLWGPPGSGKTSVVNLVARDVIQRGGIVMKLTAPSFFIDGIRVLREIQPDVPVVVAVEDIESIFDLYGESELLNVLDGSEKIHKVVFLATSNYPDRLGQRIINRPGRFDTRFKIPFPSAESRKMYFEFRLDMDGENDVDIDIDQWVKDTDKFSIAHLKELFNKVVLFGKPYKKALKSLRSMKEKIKSSDDDEQIGFLTR